MDIFSIEVASLVLALLVAGALAGFLAGLFGIGGGAVLVPVLIGVLGFAGVAPEHLMHVSVATSLGVIVPTSLRSFSAHKAKGAVDLALLKSWILPIPAGVLLASLVAAQISGDGLKGIFIAIAFCVALRMILGKSTRTLGADIPAGPLRAGIGVLIGFFSTLMGIGGGVMNNTFMTLYARPIHQAVATSSGVGVLISIPGALGMVWAGWGTPDLPPFSLGYVNLLAVAIIIPMSLWLAPIGARLAHALPKRKMEIGFGVFLLLVCLRFAFSLLG
ncbi:sulfite exporter TauE/SafE family protein [Polycladidibacter hongkongensis]|uniref:sulfite exporter TauE/SafE family protein n=1 Tax=Polycladidibacter hongkongensis TaxID=1647556 RepID=UPI0008313DA8|nr:sulfite exporter TauE/SafE family protein [Pseudovibrio hongkongensis]